MAMADRCSQKGSGIRRAASAINRMVTSCLIAFIYGYRVAIRPHLLGGCKFCPTCSEYAIEALHTFGAVRGSWLTLCRIARCHPFGRGGLDPVPLAPGSSDSIADQTHPAPKTAR